MNIKYKNILFVNPWSRGIYPPPSIGYLQSSVKKYFNDNIVVSACNIESLPHLLKINKYDLIAVSFHSFSVKHAKYIREITNKTHLVCGGHHPTSLPQQMLDIGYNQVVLGEGENKMIDIISGNNVQEIVDSCEMYYNKVNDIPFPDYSGLGDNWIDGYPIISSRGCPFKCNFCASSIFWERKWYMRSVENIIEEIKYLISTKNMTTWMFEDDNFTLNINRAKEICYELIRNNINLNWQCASRAETLVDTELTELLSKSGCKTVWLGVESLSEKTLERCNKNTTIDKMLKGIETAHNYSLGTMSQFIVGLPDDTIDNILETSKNIKKSKISRMGCNIAWILPDTEIYRKAKKYGFSDDIYLTHGAPYYTYEHSINELNNWINILNNSKK